MNEELKKRAEEMVQQLNGLPFSAVKHQTLKRWLSVIRDLLTEVERLEADNAELREACRDAWAGLRYVREMHGNVVDGVGFERVNKKCEEALGEKVPYTREALKERKRSNPSTLAKGGGDER